MPYLRIQTNQAVDSTKSQVLLEQASQQVAASLSKPEKFVMIELNDNTPMLFGGSNQDLAYLELKSIGLPEDSTKNLSQALCMQSMKS